MNNSVLFILMNGALLSHQTQYAQKRNHPLSLSSGRAPYGFTHLRNQEKIILHLTQQRTTNTGYKCQGGVA
jgi:hypothetical protein